MTTATHNPFTCVDVACATCHGLEPELCECGHDGYEGHDMRQSPPACNSCECGHGCDTCGKPAVTRRSEGGSTPTYYLCRACASDFDLAIIEAQATTGSFGYNPVAIVECPHCGARMQAIDGKAHVR